MKSFHDELEGRLESLEQEGLRRWLSLPAGIDFSSNDYLGLGRDPDFARLVRERLERLREISPDATGLGAPGLGAPGLGAPGLGAPASRLLRGHTVLHQALEERLARFKGTDGALLFPSGYQANLGVLSTLITPRDRAISDALNHASLIDGLRLSGCHKVIVPHLDIAAIERQLATPFVGGRTFLVTESLFSMDGDIAPLDRYAELCATHGAELIIDDAHATGLFGAERGSGLSEHFAIADRALAIVSTFGKAAGLAGAFVAAPTVVIDYLINRCRAFVFSTAVAPYVVVALDAALDRILAKPDQRAKVLAQGEVLRDLLQDAGLSRPIGEGPIVPVLVADSRRAIEIANLMQQNGFDVRAIRPPTVPPGTSRLRISVHADHQLEQLEALTHSLVKAWSTTESGVTSVREAPVLARGSLP